MCCAESSYTLRSWRQHLPGESIQVHTCNLVLFVCVIAPNERWVRDRDWVVPIDFCYEAMGGFLNQNSSIGSAGINRVRSLKIQRS